MRLQEIFDYLREKGEEVTLQGDGNILIEGLSTIQHGQDHTLSFFHNPRYRQYLETTKAAAILVDARNAEHVTQAAIVCANTHVAWAYVTQLFQEDYRSFSGIHPTAIIAESAVIESDVTIGAYSVIGEHVVIGKGSYIDAHCTIERNVRMGEECYLFSNVTVRYACQLGNRVVLHPNAVIGAEGFGFARGKSGYIKVAQLGRVILADDVDIGAGSCIDRGAIEDTIVGRGTKIDNHVQLGHNCIVGENTVIAGYTGIAGSTDIGNNVVIGGGVGMNGHMKIEDNVVVTGGTQVSQPLKAGKVYSSIPPVLENKEWRYNSARIKRLGDLFDRVKHLETTFKKLKEEDSKEEDSKED